MSPDDYVHRSTAARAVEQRAGNPMESGSVSLMGSSTEDLLAFFGVVADKAKLPTVTIETALEVPAVFDAVNFLSATLASLPLHAFRGGDGETGRLGGDLEMLLNEAPNEEWSSFDWRKYMWQQVFTGGRGMTWIERAGIRPVALWPMDPALTEVRRVNGRRFYRFDGRDYPATDVIDVPFMLHRDQLRAYGPVHKGRKAIALAIAMNDFAATFFASGGIPPYALEGPMPAGADAFKRAQKDIQRSIELAKQSGLPFFGMPPGHALKSIGIDPEKGQMTEARLFQIQEIARIWGLPPVFLQDLSKGTFSNTEQQDLQLVKHNIAQRAKQFEDQLNLKLFGQRRRARRVEHNLDGLQRGAFKDRIEALARGIQTAQLTPDEARALENRAPYPDGTGATGYIQSATVPLGTMPAAVGHNGGPPINENSAGDGADPENPGEEGKDPADGGNATN